MDYPIYDLMDQAGVSLSKMRICEPSGPEKQPDKFTPGNLMV